MLTIAWLTPVPLAKSLYSQRLWVLIRTPPSVKLRISQWTSRTLSPPMMTAPESRPFSRIRSSKVTKDVLTVLIMGVFSMDTVISGLDAWKAAVGMKYSLPLLRSI
ncbi:hypothetical protein D3C75_1148630 [compost metagenome]